MRWISFTAGVAALVAALVVVDAVDSDYEEPAPVASDTTTFVSDLNTTDTKAAPTEPPEPTLNELTGPISDVLGSTGYTEFMGRSDLERQLPSSIARVLSDEDAVLVVPSDVDE